MKRCHWLWETDALPFKTNGGQRKPTTKRSATGVALYHRRYSEVRSFARMPFLSTVGGGFCPVLSGLEYSCCFSKTPKNPSLDLDGENARGQEAAEFKGGI